MDQKKPARRRWRCNISRKFFGRVMGMFMATLLVRAIPSNARNAITKSRSRRAHCSFHQPVTDQVVLGDLVKLFQG